MLSWRPTRSGLPKGSTHWDEYVDLLNGISEDAQTYFENSLLGSEFTRQDVETPPVIHEYHYVQWYGNPWAGGSHDQPAIFMEMMNICNSRKMEIQRVAERNREIRESANGTKVLAASI